MRKSGLSEAEKVKEEFVTTAEEKVPEWCETLRNNTEEFYKVTRYLAYAVVEKDFSDPHLARLVNLFGPLSRAVEDAREVLAEVDRRFADPNEDFRDVRTDAERQESPTVQ